VLDVYTTSHAPTFLSALEEKSRYAADIAVRPSLTKADILLDGLFAGALADSSFSTAAMFLIP
jgi:hypothetical protein